jgi:hypothetical protein
VKHGSWNEHSQNLLPREDTKELLGFLLAKSTAGTGGSTGHNKKGLDGCFTKRATKKNLTLLLILGKLGVCVSKNFPLMNLRKGAASASMNLRKGAASASSTKPEQTTNPVHLSVINSLEAAKVHYSAKSLFVANLTCERADQEAIFAYESSSRAEQLYEFRGLAKAEWVLAEPKIVDFWEAQSRSKILVA